MNTSSIQSQFNKIGLPPSVNDSNEQQQPAQNLNVQNHGNSNASGLEGVQNLRSPKDVHSVGAQNNVVPNEVLRGTGQSGVKAFFSAIRNWFEETFSKAPELKESITVQVPGEEKLVTIKKEEYEPMIRALPKSQQAAAMSNLQTTYQNRISNGMDVYCKIVGNQPQEATKDKVADLLLYFRAKASAKGQGFMEGALSIEDPDGKLLAFLKSCNESYTRSSTHMESLQDVRLDGGQGDLNIQRGIDIAPGPNGLPCGHRTVLFGAIVPPPDVPGMGGMSALKQRLFLKPETFGCRISTLSSSKDAQGRIATHGANRPLCLRDFGEFLGHGASLIWSRINILKLGDKSNEQNTRKEHLPKEIAKLYSKTLDELSTNSDFGAVRKILNDAKAKDEGYGIRSLRLALNVINSHHYLEIPGKSSQGHTLSEIVRKLDNRIKKDYPYDAEYRLGHEVILNRDELEVNGVNPAGNANV